VRYPSAREKVQSESFEKFPLALLNIVMPDLIRHPVFLDTSRIPGRALPARKKREFNRGSKRNRLGDIVIN
jgi:hypothetical protein